MVIDIDDDVVASVRHRGEACSSIPHSWQVAVSRAEVSISSGNL